MANFSLNVKVNGVEQSVSTIGQLEEALNATREELKGIEIGSESFKELTTQARVLQGELENTFEKATNFNGQLDNITQSVGRLGSTIASGFAVATAAFGLFAGESEDLTQAQIKAQQALAIAFGATTIATNAARLSQDLKNVVDALGLNLSRAKTAATIVNTGATTANAAAQTANAAATTAATVATRGFTAALAANPIGLVLVGLTALVGLFFAFGDSAEEAAEETDNYTDSLERTNSAIDRNIEVLREQYRVQIELAKLRGEDTKALQLETQALEDELSIRKAQLDRAISDVENYVIRKTNLLDSLAAKEEDITDQFNTVAIDATYVAQTKILEIETGFNDLRAEADAAEFARKKKEFLSNTEQLVSILDGFLKYDPENTALKSLIDNYRNLTKEITKLENDVTIKQEQELQKRREAYKKAYDKIVEDTKKSLKELNDLEKGYTEELTKLQLEQAKNKEALVNNELRLETEKVNAIFDLRQKEIDEFFGPKSKKGIELTNQLEKEKSETITALEFLFNKRRELAVKEDNAAKAEADALEAKLVNISKILDSEIAFGDQNTLDRKETLYARILELESNALAFEIQNNELSVQDFEKTKDKILQLTKESLKIRQQVELDEARAAQERDLKNLEENLKKEFGAEKEFKEILGKFKRNQDEELKIKEAEINEKYRQENELAEKQSADDIFAYKIQKLQEYSQLVGQFLNTGLELASAINDLNRAQDEANLITLRENLAAQGEAYNAAYEQELESLNNKFQSGQISQEAYNNSITQLNAKLNANIQGLNDKQAKAELDAKKKAFESDKKLKIAQAIISGAQGAVSAFTGAMQLGPIAGPIVGAILAAAVGVTTGIQVAAIKATKFDSGASIPSASTGGGVGGVGGAAAIADATGGGFTGFNDTLTGTPTGGAGQNPGVNISDSMNQRVYVVESDITNTQNRVQVLENGASFG